jgi:hypothetical protein
MSNYENHIIYPTYQSILMNTIGTVIERMNNGETFSAWLALRNLYRWLPGEVKAEVKPTHEKINQTLNQIKKQNIHLDYYLRRQETHKQQEQYLVNSNELFCDEISESLRKHNWLDRDATIKPRDQTMPTLKVKGRP